MLKITENKTAHASHLIVEADFSKHIKSMKLATSTGLGKTVGLVIAKASMDETNPTPKVEKNQSTTDKFYQGLYDSTPEDKKVERLLGEFHEESNGIKKVLKKIGWKGLEIEFNRKPFNVREYNLSLLRKD